MQPNQLWAPWRMSYIRQLDASNAPQEKGGCFLCAAGQVSEGSREAEERLVLVRDDRGIILLNRFPYTSGHLLVSVPEHIGDLVDLSPGQRGNLMELTALAQQIVTRACQPQGVNIGINLGRCAGAGLPGHLHVHIVPRWNGDTNFMNVVGNVRIVPEALGESYANLRRALADVRGA